MPSNQSLRDIVCGLWHCSACSNLTFYLLPCICGRMALDLVVKGDDVGIISGNYHHFDSAGFLLKFLWTWRDWMVPFVWLIFQSPVSQCSGYVRSYDIVWKCINFVVVEFNIDIGASVCMALLCFGKVMLGPMLWIFCVLCYWCDRHLNCYLNLA